MDVVPDKALLRKVNQQLVRMGGAQMHVTASVQRGDVTLSGNLQYEMQRPAIVRAASRVSGVRRVIDQLKVVQKKRI